MIAHRTVAQIGQWLLLSMTCALSACQYQVVEDNREASTPLSDDNDAAELNGDALLAPEAPTFYMRTLRGALEFNWQASQSVELGEITSQALYHFDDRTNTEERIDATLSNSDTTYTLDISPHQIHWDSSSYRIEICYASTCLSSRRISIAGHVGNTLSSITPDSQPARSSFGHDVAVNANGNVTVTAIPNSAMALVHFYVGNHWVEGSYLRPSAMQGNTPQNMKVAISASGDTVVLAGISNNAQPNMHVFDRLGESWVETASINLAATAPGLNWLADSLALQLSADGDAFLVGIKPAGSNNNQMSNSTDNAIARNTLHYFTREGFGWQAQQALTLPLQFDRLTTFAGSDDLNTVATLANNNGLLRIELYQYTGIGWQSHLVQTTDQIVPSDDMLLATNTDATELVLAAWEVSNTGTRTPVSWRFTYQTASSLSPLQQTDSVRLPPVSDSYAKLRLATDAQLDTLAIGWQGLNASNLAIFNLHENRWHYNVSVPAALNVSTTLAMIQSVALSRSSNTLLIGVPSAASGGLLTVFK